MSHQKFTLILQSRELITPRVMKFGFVRSDGEPFEYIPGQFLTLHLPWEDMVLRRSYSVATIPNGAAGMREIEIAVTAVEDGRATGVLFNLCPGERVEATGPFGRFVLRDDPPSRYLLIGTGTGVSPYRAMLPALRERLREDGFEAQLMLGVRSPEELLFGADFETFADAVEGFRFLPSFSRHQPQADAAGVHGYVQHRLAEIALDPAHDIVYLCGNPIMIDEAVAHLKAAGFTNPGIRREKYVSSN
ncbi:MAG: FAD-binding oxidoreductase [Gammaproteobacteria bacterium]